MPARTPRRLQTPQTPQTSRSTRALPSTPGLVQCFSTQCEGGAACCSDNSKKTTMCGSPCASCPLGQTTFACDEEDDCAPNEHCCLDYFGSSSCRTDCTTTGVGDHRLCVADRECPTGTLCLLVTCHGVAIGACAPVPEIVSSFCDAGDGG